MTDSHATTPTSEQEDDKRTRRLMAPCMHCGFEPPLEECAEYSRDMYRDLRRSALLMEVDKRRGTDALVSDERYSSGFIVEQAAERFFSLVAVAERDLRGRFTEDEFLTILNAECTPIWQDRFANLATIVADDQGVESLDDLEPGHPLRVLLEKLIALTPLENAALVDVCERIWRGYKNPLL